MASKIFVNYRRDDDPAAAARVRDGLVVKFGKSNVFMDVDNLLAGQRFDKELTKALGACDVLIAVMGEKWMGILRERAAALEANPDERDYVREEIAAALKRGIVVIPVRVGRDGKLPPLPRPSDLPADIRELVAHQQHDVRHETHGRDIADLFEAITIVRRKGHAESIRSRPWALISVCVTTLVAAGYVSTYVIELPDWWPGGGTVRPNRPTVVVASGIRNERAKAEVKKKTEEESARDNVAALTPGSGQTARDCWRDGDRKVCGPEMVVVPAGSFLMGSPKSEVDRDTSEDGPDGKPLRVRIPDSFAAGLTHVTRGEFAVFANETGYKLHDRCEAQTASASWQNPGFEQDDSHPVVCLNWNDAKVYAAWLARKTGKPYRLLSETETEYAIRGVTSASAPHPQYWWASDERELCRYANGPDQMAKQSQGSSILLFAACSDGHAYTAPAGSFPANKFGLKDAAGNVFSWTEDCWNDSHVGNLADGSARIMQCADDSRRVVRGGSWFGNYSRLRAAYRFVRASDFRSSRIGFRVGRTLTP